MLITTVVWAGSPAGAQAAQPPVGLGTADAFAVLGGSAVTNTGPSVINGDLAVSPGTAVTGFPPGLVNGATHSADAPGGQAKSDLTAAYNDAAGRTPAAAVSGDIGGLTVTPGVYKSSSSVMLTGTVTLDAQGDPAAVFIFQIGSTLTTASASRVRLVNGASPCNVYWQVGSSATIGTTTTMIGTVMALTSISAETGANVDGRLLARNGAVTLDTNTITRGTCAAAGTDTGSGTGTTGPGTTGTTTSGSGTTGTGTQTGPAGTGTGSSGTGTGTGTGAGTGVVGTPALTTGGAAILTTTPKAVAKMIGRHGTHRCVGGTFRALVTGSLIRRVVFTMGTRVMGTKTRGPFAIHVVTHGGIHTLRARITFKDATPAARVKLVFRGCAAARAAAAPKHRRTPHFTG